MFQDSILYKIFLRYLKEKNMSLYFFKCNSKGYLINVEYRIISENTNNLLSAFSLNYFPKLWSNDRKFNDFCNNWNNNNEFNSIILFAMKPYIKEFLIKEGIVNSFIENVCEFNKYVKTSIPENKRTKSNIDLIINEYLNYLIYNNDSIFYFIRRSFYYFLSGKDTDLWYDLDRKFKKYIIETLLSKFERKEISNLKRLFLKLQNNIISLIKQKR